MSLLFNTHQTQLSAALLISEESVSVPEVMLSYGAFTLACYS